MGDATEDFASQPLEVRLESKLWKARVSAYEELASIFARTPSEDDPAFAPFTRDPERVRAMVLDSNAAAQEKGVEAVKAFVQYGGRMAGKTREAVLPGLADKCLGSMRTGTRNAAMELVLLYVAHEDVNGCDGPVSDLITAFSSKQPKVAAAALRALTQVVQQFGARQVNVKPIIQKLPAFFGHADKNVRAEASLLAVELHRCVGVALKPALAQLKEIQVKELEALFADAPPAGAPQMYLVSQRPQEEQAAATDKHDDCVDGAAGDEAVEAVEESPVDAFDLADPVDVSKCISGNFFEMAESKKWQERKEVFDGLQEALAKAVRLSPSSAVDGIIDVLQTRIQKDANINVVLSACRCVERLADCLRADFGKYVVLLPVLLEKFKDKKPTTVEVVRAALDALFRTVSFGEIMEPTLAAASHKNPAVKAEAIRYFVRSLQKTRSAPSAAEIKPLATVFVAAMSDGASDVRDAGATGLGTLMKLIGERPMMPFLDSLDDIKKGKVNEEFQNASVSAKSGAKPAAAAAPRPAVAAPKPASPKPAPRAASPPKPVQRAPAPKPAASAPRPLARPAPRPAAPAASPAKPAARPPAKAAPKAKADGEVSYKYSSDDAERAAEYIPDDVRTQLSSSNWKERVEGARALVSWSASADVDAELIVRYLEKHPGWRESNFQVLGEIYNVFKTLTTRPTFSRACVVLALQPLCDKLGDIKLKSQAGETLAQLAEHTSLGFVLVHAIPLLGALRAPKAAAEALLWLDQMILDFGTASVHIHPLVEYLVASLKSANAGVRANATKVVGTLARYVGATLGSLLGELNPQLRATLDAEIEKAASNPPPAPTRGAVTSEVPAEAADEQAAAETAAETAAAAPAGPSEEELEQLCPRQDVDTLISQALIDRLGDANWKERKAALEEMQSIVAPHPRLRGALADLTPALRARYSDNNLMVRTLALELLATFAQRMNALFEPHARAFAGPVAQVLADAKAPIRAAAAKTLTAMAESVGIADMVPSFGQVLDGKGANPTLRQHLFEWLLSWLEGHPSQNIDLAPCVPSVLLSLDDRLAPVRKASQDLLPFLVAQCGYKFVVEQVGNLKTASQNTAMPLVDAARSKVGAGRQAASAPAAPAPPKAPTARAPAASVARAPLGRAEPVARPTIKAPVTATARPVPTSRVRAAPAKVPSPVKVVDRAASPPKPKPRPSAVSRSLRAPVTAHVSHAPSSAPLFSSEATHKAARARTQGKAPFVVDGAVRPSQVAMLKQQFDAVAVPDLVDALFSTDHNAERDYITGLSSIADLLRNQGSVTAEDAALIAIANADLIIKYVCVRLLENNTTVTLKAFEVVDALFDSLSSAAYAFTDQESEALVACLVVRSGDAKAVIRERVKGLFRRITALCAPTRLLVLLIEYGLPSKNSRTRTETLAEIAHLIAKNGLQVCVPAKTLPVLAQAISDRDSAVRSAALAALGEAYTLMGDSFWRTVGPLPARDESLLAERCRRIAPSAPTQEATPRRAAVATPKRTMPSVRNASPAHTASPRQIPKVPRARLPVQAAPSPGPAPKPPVRVSVPDNDALADLDTVQTGDSESCIAALKAMQDMVSNTELHSGELGNSLARAVGARLETSDGTLDARLIKHLLQTILVLLDAERRNDGINEDARLGEDAISVLVCGLLHQLMDMSARADESAQTLSKHLNAVVLRVLAGCRGDDVYGGCFSALIRASRSLLSLDGPELDRATRFGELVVKCLWKAARKLPAALNEGQVHGERLLAAVENFFQAIPPVEWGRRAQKQLPLRDIPLITATNILKQIVDTVGERALTMLDSLSDPEGSHVYRYLLRLLYIDEQQQQQQQQQSARETPASVASPSRTSSANAAPIDEATQELRGIFDRISQKDQSRQAIRELYEFQKRHPEKQGSIDRSLQNTGPIFQRYIKRALANHAAEDRDASAARAQPAAQVDARLAELKAKFNREGETTSKRRSMTAAESIRQRLAEIRDDAQSLD
ncbi:hypothetical protein MCUN1_002759 [Malassezia cuniculi]|uniref:TOG domain-containing protein n=1 Tax=Malassezia cuniculi TaxID=948313 RepID=A0AAF0EX26_9BASI|nr:hypothetical protein MCUN1_002759 [Malassezia cuniculi]